MHLRILSRWSWVWVVAMLIGCQSPPESETEPETAPAPDPVSPAYNVATYTFRAIPPIRNEQTLAQVLGTLQARVDPYRTGTTRVHNKGRRQIVISAIQSAYAMSVESDAIRMLCEPRGQLSFDIVASASNITHVQIGQALAVMQRFGPTQPPIAGYCWRKIRHPEAFFGVPVSEMLDQLELLELVTYREGVVSARFGEDYFVLACEDDYPNKSAKPWQAAMAEVSTTPTSQTSLLITLDVATSYRLRQYTKNHRGQNLGIILDGEVVDVVPIGDSLGQYCEIIGHLSQLEAGAIARILSAPPLPIDLVYASSDITE